jgi:hypothetical protein
MPNKAGKPKWEDGARALDEIRKGRRSVVTGAVYMPDIILPCQPGQVQLNRLVRNT